MVTEKRPAFSVYQQEQVDGNPHITELIMCCLCGKEVRNGVEAPRYMGGLSRKTVLCIACISQCIDVIVQHDWETRDGPCLTMHEIAYVSAASHEGECIKCGAIA